MKCALCRDMGVIYLADQLRMIFCPRCGGTHSTHASAMMESESAVVVKFNSDNEARQSLS